MGGSFSDIYEVGPATAWIRMFGDVDHAAAAFTDFFALCKIKPV
jgi:hypothetical protein